MVIITGYFTSKRRNIWFTSYHSLYLSDLSVATLACSALPVGFFICTTGIASAGAHRVSMKVALSGRCAVLSLWWGKYCFIEESRVIEGVIVKRARIAHAHQYYSNRALYRNQVSLSAGTSICTTSTVDKIPFLSWFVHEKPVVISFYPDRPCIIENAVRVKWTPKTGQVFKIGFIETWLLMPAIALLMSSVRALMQRSKRSNDLLAAIEIGNIIKRPFISIAGD